MFFWRLESPTYEDDYEELAVNSLLRSPYALPALDCEVCGVWSAFRTLRHECPESLRTHPHMLDRTPIPRLEHEALRRELSRLLGPGGMSLEELWPGDTLQPGYLDIPAVPRTDFLWSAIGTVLVSERVRLLLTERAPGAISFVRVQPRKVGSLDPASAPRAAPSRAWTTSARSS